MSRLQRLEVLNRIVETGLMPVFYHADAETACKVSAACAAGGAKAFEFTNRGERALDVFKTMTQYCREHASDLVLGAGSIIDEPTAALFINNGANFIVGPSFHPGVARLCNRRKVAYMPGCMTATEIATAEESGVEIVKVFPCESVGGPDFVKAILGPCPWTRIMPTGIRDINQSSLNEWFAAGVVAVGIGRTLMRQEYVERQNFTAITKRAEEILDWVRNARRR